MAFWPSVRPQTSVDLSSVKQYIVFKEWVMRRLLFIIHEIYNKCQCENVSMNAA